MRKVGKWSPAGLLIFLGYFLACAAGGLYDVPNEKTVLNTLRKEHPRLILLQEDIPRIKDLIHENAAAREIYTRLKEEADQILTQPTVEYKIIGPRLLSQSRRCLDRVYKLGLLYRLEGDRKYLKRALEELDAAAAFPDWNPSHFLDTAELAHAFAIAYDWLYHDITPEQRNKIRSALVEKGLKAYLKGFEEDRWWTRATHNWNQVCHGGIGIGALAVADELPDMAATVLSKALQQIPLALKGYAPDGGWNEGPGYWHYATRYTVYFFASLNTALGTDFGLSDYEGLDKAGLFRIHFQGPTGKSFNYADAHSAFRGTHEMYWLAQRYNQPVYAWHQWQDWKNPHALDLIWYSAKSEDPQAGGVPLNAFYRGIDVVFFRTAWNDPNAIFVGFKGGDNKANHSHLDLGGFVLDADGLRWAVDLGGDNYNLPNYFGKLRWTYYRLINKSHNTLVIDNENQDPQAAAPIIQFHSSPRRAFAIADLTQAYSLERVHRGIAMIDGKHILVQDEIEANTPVEILWGMLTPASIKIENRTVTLEQKEKRLQVRILSPSGARFDVVSANPPKPQRQQPHIQKLVVRLPQKEKTVRLAVLLTPYANADRPPLFYEKLKPLSQWTDQ